MAGGVEPAINLRRMLIGSPFRIGAGTPHDKRQINICQSSLKLVPRPRRIKGQVQAPQI